MSNYDINHIIKYYLKITDNHKISISANYFVSIIHPSYPKLIYLFFKSNCIINNIVR